MRIDVLTLFPEMFVDFLNTSIVGIAVKQNKISPQIVNIRDFAFNKHRQVDDYPYGGGSGMVMKPEPIFEALKFAQNERFDIPVIYFTPQGKLLKQQTISKYCDSKRLILLCGHYKEIDQRIRERYVTEELSIGDYVLSGGELPAMVFIDALARLQEDVIGDIESALNDSFQDGILGCPHYTRPRIFENMEVPEVLLSGNHKRIEEWRERKAFELTQQVRPDLLK